MNDLIVYKASAGSGKTFTLAARYVSRLAYDPKAYRKILAVTFTNKATAEMKERILKQLKSIAENAPASEGFLNEVMRHCHKPAEDIRDAARQALTNIVHDYSRFRIETIDSFFQTVIRNLARELGIGASMNLDLDNESAISDAVDSILDNIQPDSNELKWIMEYIQSQISENNNWRIADSIKTFGQNIFNERYVEKGGELRKKLDDPKFIGILKRSLKQRNDESLGIMKSFYTRFMNILESHGIEPSDLYKSGVIENYFKRLNEGKLGDEIVNKTVNDNLVRKESWCSKTSNKLNVIHNLAETELMPLLQEAEEKRLQCNFTVNSCKLTLMHLDKLRLLNTIAAEVDYQNREKNRFLLSETNKLLKALLSEGDAPFVYEKIGTNLDTIMIDEFQDTSSMQWSNFKPLIAECLANRSGSLVVGDIKQSIYRWRNGDWSILANLTDPNRKGIKTCTLDTNWRSEANIIKFNNYLFHKACTLLGQKYQGEYREPFRELEAAYSDVAQKTNKPGDKGYVKVSFITGDEDQLELLSQQVDTLVKSGVRPSDITILVRYNRVIPDIAKHFEANTPFRIVSDEAFRLDASVAVRILTDALRYINCPEDKIVLTQLAWNYQRCVLRSDISLDSLVMGEIKDYIPEPFFSEAETLSDTPLYELFIKLIAIFEIDRIDGQEIYLSYFFDNVIAYTRDGSAHIGDFIEYFDKKLSAKTVPATETDGIRIMSIHKAKGLEFHTLLLPYCDWNMETGRNDHLLWATPDDSSLITLHSSLPLMPVYYGKAMSQSVYGTSYVEEKKQLWIDNLNLLYVAFTRASKNLIVWGKIKETKNEFTTATLLKEVLDNEDIYEIGEILKSEERRVKSEESLIPHSNRESYIANRKSNDSSLSTPHSTLKCEFRQSNKSSAFINDGEESDRNQYIQQGLLLHNLFSSIEKADDIADAITRLRFEGVIESDKHEQQIRKLADWAIKHPKAREWFDGSWQLMNERSIVFTDTQGNVQTRRPDRVMMKDGLTVIVDFKFGNPKDEHVHQVEEYVSLLNKMENVNIEGYIWYVFKNQVIKVKCK